MSQIVDSPHGTNSVMARTFAASHGNSIEGSFMHRTRNFLAFALMACVSFVCASFAAVQSVIVSTYQTAKRFVLDGFALIAGEGEGFAKPAVMRVQAKAFVVRLAKRERPVMTSSWRMCPST